MIVRISTILFIFSTFFLYSNTSNQVGIFATPEGAKAGVIVNPTPKTLEKAASIINTEPYHSSKRQPQTFTNPDQRPTQPFIREGAQQAGKKEWNKPFIIEPESGAVRTRDDNLRKYTP